MTDVLKIFLSSEVENKIGEYLLKIESTIFLSELNLDLNSSNISLKSSSLKELENLKSIWLEIAHLSVNLYLEYEFFRQFSFPSRYESLIYEESLRKLGYKQHKGIWKINEIPNKQCIIENIFYSYIYIFLFQKKQQELDNKKFIKENAENSKKLAKLIKESRKADVNNTVDELNDDNMEVVIPSNREMGNISNDLNQESGGDGITDKITIGMNLSDFIINNQLENNNHPINNNWNNESLNTSINSNLTDYALQNINSADNKDKWTCSQCTFRNETTVDFCKICYTQNINKIGTMDDYELPEETWCCKRCGENNLFEYYKCKSCRLPADFVNKWRCEQCSYYNDEVASCCGACEIKNPYLIKCYLCVKTLVNKTHGRICKQCSILSERCTNNDTLDQNNRKTQSETSEVKNVSSKGDQRREKQNEHQINFNNNGSQFTGGKSKDSTDDRKMDCENTASLRIYATSESDNSLSKGDQNRGKLKNKNSPVDATNKINSKQCKNCKSKSCYNNQYWCDKCENLKWYCQNDACNGINFKNEHCKLCKAKKGSNFSNCMHFCVMKDAKEVNMWQCGFCLQFVDGTLKKCIKCQNIRDLSCYRKCKCNWNNLNIRGKCDKCGADLK